MQSPRKNVFGDRLNRNRICVETCVDLINLLSNILAKKLFDVIIR